MPEIAAASAIVPNRFTLSDVFAVAFFEYKEDEIFPKPPSYNVATSLPSYDEAERSKAETSVPLVTDRVSVWDYYLQLIKHSFDTCVLVPLLQDEDFIARDSFDDTDQLRVGNDGIFMLTFFSKSTQYSLCFWSFFALFMIHLVCCGLWMD